MPLLKLQTTATLAETTQDALLTALSRIVAETLGKPETYVMVTIEPAAIRMSPATGDAAFVDIRSIGGLDPEVNRSLSDKVCAVLQDRLGVPPERVYLNFTNVAAVDWGWKSGTFG